MKKLHNQKEKTGLIRLGEIEAAIGIEQLKKLKKIVKKKQKTAKILFNGLKNLKGLNLPVIEKNFTHSYYVFAMSINTNIIKTKTSDIKNFLNEKEIDEINILNASFLAIFQNKVAYDKNFPWILNKRKINYKKGICPNAEYLHDKAFIGLNLCNFDYSDQDMKFIIKCFKSIWEKKVLFF